MKVYEAEAGNLPPFVHVITLEESGLERVAYWVKTL